MIKLQMARWGEDWLDTPSAWPSEWIARQAIENGHFDDLGDLIAEGKYWYRLIDETGKVLELWQCLPYVGYPYLLPMADNPFAEMQEAYELEDDEMIEMCEKYLKHKRKEK